MSSKTIIIIEKTSFGENNAHISVKVNDDSRIDIVIVDNDTQEVKELHPQKADGYCEDMQYLAKSARRKNL